MRPAAAGPGGWPGITYLWQGPRHRSDGCNRRGLIKHHVQWFKMCLINLHLTCIPIGINVIWIALLRWLHGLRCRRRPGANARRRCPGCRSWPRRSRRRISRLSHRSKSLPIRCRGHHAARRQTGVGGLTTSPTNSKRAGLEVRPAISRPQVRRRIRCQRQARFQRGFQRYSIPPRPPARSSLIFAAGWPPGRCWGFRTAAPYLGGKGLPKASCGRRMFVLVAAILTNEAFCSRFGWTTRSCCIFRSVNTTTIPGRLGRLAPSERSGSLVYLYDEDSVAFARLLQARSETPILRAVKT